MKSFSRIALAAALLAGTAGFVLDAPAAAQKKQKEQKDGLKLSNEVRTSAQAYQAAFTAKDLVTAETHVKAIEAAAKTDDDRYIGQAFRLQLEATKLGSGGNESILAGPLDALIANPKTPQAEIGRFNYMRGNIAFNAKQYAVALASYNRAKQLGFTDPNMMLQIAKSKILSGDTAGGAADIETAIAADKAAGRPVSEDLYKYAISNLQKTNDGAATQRWTRNWLHSYGTPKNWRTAIYVFGFQGAGAQRIDKRQRVDLFRLMRATNALADQNDYLEYAQAALDIGLPNETKTVVAEGRANGRIPATSANATALLNEATKAIQADGSLSSLETKAKASASGQLAAQTGDANLGAGNYAKAVELYRLALQKGSVNADEVNTHLGIALAKSGDKAGAKAAFAAVKMAPRTEIATLWTTWIDAPAA